MKDMILYKDNPTLPKLTVVETVDGSKEYRRNTKYIDNKYYVINKDCFEVNGKWFRKDSGYIIYDHELKKWILISDRRKLIQGLVLNEKKEIEVGYFTPNPYNNVKTSTAEWGNLPAISADIFSSAGWFEDMGGNLWFRYKDCTNSTVLKRKSIRNERSHTDRGYNIEDNNDYPIKVELYNKYNTEISDKAEEMSKYLGNLTFGCEFELAKGDIGGNLKNRHGLVSCRDGSLNGGVELVTIPLSGAKGLQTTVNICKDLTPRGLIDLSCSFHIHFGNMRTDELYIISLYRLIRSVQNELFTMFPYYKVVPDGVKQKNYTKKLLKLNIHTLKDTSDEGFEAFTLDSWYKMFNFYGEGKISLEDFNKKTRAHPIEQKWSRKNRYFCFNFLNLFFGHRHTLEARLHSGTLNFHKVINWLFICVALIKYAEKYTTDIVTLDKTISLKEVLDIYPTLFPEDKKALFISKYLYEYFLERQARLKKDLEKGDYISEWDINEDKSYEFSYQGVKGLI